MTESDDVIREIVNKTRARYRPEAVPGPVSAKPYTSPEQQAEIDAREAEVLAMTELLQQFVGWAKRNHVSVDRFGFGWRGWYMMGESSSVGDGNETDVRYQTDDVTLIVTTRGRIRVRSSMSGVSGTLRSSWHLSDIQKAIAARVLRTRHDWP